MSGRGRNRGNRQQSDQTSSLAETGTTLAADSPILAVFKEAASILTDRQDRHERLVKLSRDVTIESKRIIFYLHSAPSEDIEKATQEAHVRFQKLINGPIKSIGLELENTHAYLHSRAVTAGFQEYVEARTLLSLIEKNEIVTWAELQKEFTYTIKENEEERQLVTMLTHTDYILGIADLTGELMRRAIKSVSSGDKDKCLHACQVLRDLYIGFQTLWPPGKELNRKFSTTRANLFKVELALYEQCVRGKEAPPALLLPPPAWDRDQPPHIPEEEDEGVFA